MPYNCSICGSFFAKAHIKRIHTNVEDIDVANSLTPWKLATPTHLITMIFPTKMPVINSFDGHRFMCLMYEINRLNFNRILAKRLCVFLPLFYYYYYYNITCSQKGFSAGNYKFYILQTIYIYTHKHTYIHTNTN